MTLYQHVYGRVAVGYAASGPGHQLAALSPALEPEWQAIERLNRSSFCTYRRGGYTPVRYSFSHPGAGRVAFGASRLARDATGAVGAFAHHFVGATSALVESGLTPVELLAALRPHFLAGEAALGAERRLPPLETEALTDLTPERAGGHEGAERTATDASDQVRSEPDAAAAADPRVWALLDACLATPFGARPRGPVPLVVLPDSAVWPFLDAVFRRLSPQRSAEISFSTLFVEASSYAADFRFVLAPEVRDEPAGASPFRVLRPGQDFELRAAANQRQGPYVDVCRRWPSLVWETRRFIDLSHRQPNDVAAGGPLLDTILHTSEEAAGAFRAACESEATPRALLLRLLLACPARALRYWRRGEAVAYDEALADVVWEDAATRLPALLRIAADGRHSAMRDDALADLAARIRITPEASALLHALDRHQYRALLEAAAPQVTRWLPAPENPIALLRHAAFADDFEWWALARRPALPVGDQVTLLADLIALRHKDDACAEIATAIAADPRGIRLATRVLHRLGRDDTARVNRERRVLRDRLRAIARRGPWHRVVDWLAGEPRT